MASLYPLFSSSKGNSYYLGSKSAGILIDVGVTFKRLNNALKLNDLDISGIKGVFITHEHSDHIKGLKLLTSKTGVAVYGHRNTLEYLEERELVSSSSDLIEVNDSVEVAGMQIERFNTPHDSEESCGYRIHTEDGRTCTICTDLGHITPTVRSHLLGSNLVVLESNYDEEMLRKGPYPYFLKSRISSQRGHLSNNDCAKQCKELIENGTTRIILGHLSQENNSPEIADSNVEKYLCGMRRNSDYVLSVADVETKGERVIF